MNDPAPDRPDPARDAQAAPGYPGIIRIVAPNPGPMTLTGTNTYLVESDGAAYVIDPGPDDPGHLEAIRIAATARGGIAGVLLTHGHSDHTDGVAVLGAELLWGDPGPGDEAAALAAALAGSGRIEERALDDHGEPALADDELANVGPFAVLPTPGHAADHVCFVLGEVVLCGDLILGSGSSIVPPRLGGGSLSDYMDSLERVASLDPALLAPGHGPWIDAPRQRIAEYVEHRLSRERRLLAALERGERSRSALVAEAWDDVPAMMRPAAAIAMQAHLEKLEREGRLDPVELVE